MALEIKNTKDAKDLCINYVIYGQSGVGKTSLIKQFPSEKVLVLSAEDGLLSVKDHSVDFVNIKSVKDVNEVIEQLKDTEYKYIFIDSITELSQNHYMKLDKEWRAKALSEGKKEKFYSMHMWGQFSSDFSHIFKELRRMEKTVIALGLEKSKENAIGQSEFMPDFYGKTGERIVAWFDECFRMFIKDGKRVFLTDKTDLSWAKDRSTKLDKICDSNLYEIHKKICS